MSFCSYCRKIPPNVFSSARDTQCTIHHQPSYIALENSAIEGCPLCALLIHAVEVHSTEPGVNFRGHKWKRTEAVTLGSTKQAGPAVQIGYKRAGEIRGKPIPDEWSTTDPIIVKPNGKVPSSDEYLDREASVIKAWLEACSTHKNCKSIQNSQYLPTRVVDVGTVDSTTVRLRLTSESDRGSGRYLALSHCWGLAMSSSAMTHLSTFESNLNSIELSSLPRTFVDFIHIARRINVPYVWIDSLCIIQDLESDWEFEAAQMSAVYSNAYLTVSASSSADGRGGCHVYDDHRAHGPVDLECTPQNTPEEDKVNKSKFQNTPAQKIRIYTLPTYPLANIIRSDPLTSRGWTMQERELSPRAIHYSKDSIRWECRGVQASLEFPWDDSLAFNSDLRIFDAGQLDRHAKVPDADLSMKAEEESRILKQRMAWFEIVGRYTTRALTKEIDIFPAISGIVHSIHDKTGDIYYAGLWESYFVRCLLWTSRWNIQNGIKTHSRPTPYLAPSWSWASIKGPTEYEWLIHSNYCWNANPDPEYMPTVHEVVTDPTGSDAYGMLKGGFLRIEGKSKFAFSLNEGYSMQGNNQNQEGLHCVVNGSVEQIGWITFDTPLCTDCAPPGEPTLVLVLCCLPQNLNPDQNLYTVGLALQIINQSKGECVRVGLVRRIKTEWWTDAEKLLLTIL